MLQNVRKKIINSKIFLEPFPYLFVKNFLNKNDITEINRDLPSFKEIEGADILYQSTSKTKKTLLPNSSIYKDLVKKDSFKKINLLGLCLWKEIFIFTPVTRMIKNLKNMIYLFFQTLRLVFLTLDTILTTMNITNMLNGLKK